MRDRDRAAAPDYTNAALVMGLVNLLWSFMLIWASLGLPAVVVTAVFLNYLITRLEHRRAREG
ncbi:histidinol phosphate aminotransferase [Marimonas lutisalis]|uniref:histidinol phosphate aminotransferase n=1 Tax=Marimonas lutisalis TaxID=2545756 RepID=UPI0010F78E1A|nr:histidinol phosphate aminotransferase [Marimonas lutisalis]